jgi:hypothetical protein
MPIHGISQRETKAKSKQWILNFWDMVTWLRHYATSLKVLGLNPNEVTGFFN